MDHLTLLDEAERNLHSVVAGLDPSELEGDTNCPPWTVRRLVSHALKNQLFWAGTVSGQQLMALDESMAAVPYEGDLAPIAAEVCERVVDLWHGAGVLDAEHETPFGVLPGSVVVDFAVIDATAHAWDIAASVGRPIQFPDEWIPAMTDVVALTCTDHAVEIGLIKPPVTPPSDATDTERLMALAGRTIRR